MRVAVGLLLALLASATAAREVPYLAGRVNDLAEMIPAQTRDQLETRLAALESEKGSQIAVLTIDTLEGEALEDYALRVAETWKLGRGQFDDGALLLIVRDDRKMRLEVGYGLEPVLTDAHAIRILDDVIRPRFKQGDFGGGIAAGVEAIDGTVRGQDVLPPPSEGGQAQDLSLGGRLVMLLVFSLVIGTFSMGAITSPGGGAWFLYFFLIPFWLIFPMAILANPFGLVFVVAWLVGFPILRLLLHHTEAGRKYRAARPWMSSLPSMGGGSWSSGGRRSGVSWGSGRSWGGGGGFSGGGGSFGGGGASSSW